MSHLDRRFSEMLSMQFPARILDLDFRSAIYFAVIAARRQRIGRPTEVQDPQIASICLANSAFLATRNARDFENTGVELIDAWGA